jgi:hypothetical protein
MVPQPSVARCENGAYSLQCPECGEFIDVDSVEHEVGEGDRRGHHTEPDPARYEAHFRKEHAREGLL